MLSHRYVVEELAVVLVVGSVVVYDVAAVDAAVEPIEEVLVP